MQLLHKACLRVNTTGDYEIGQIEVFDAILSSRQGVSGAVTKPIQTSLGPAAWARCLLQKVNFHTLTDKVFKELLSQLKVSPLPPFCAVFRQVRWIWGTFQSIFLCCLHHSMWFIQPCHLRSLIKDSESVSEVCMGLCNRARDALPARQNGVENFDLAYSLVLRPWLTFFQRSNVPRGGLSRIKCLPMRSRTRGKCPGVRVRFCT